MSILPLLGVAVSKRSIAEHPLATLREVHRGGGRGGHRRNGVLARPYQGLEPIDNPLGLEGILAFVMLTEALLCALRLVAAASVLMRLRRSTGVEWQQIKWFAYVSVLLATTTVIAYVLSEASSQRWLGWPSSLP